MTVENLAPLMKYDLTSFQQKMLVETDQGVAGKVSQYLLIREELAKMEEEYNKVKKPLQEIKAILEGWFDKFLTDTKQQSAVTDKGTVHWNMRWTSSVKDPEAFMNYVTQSERWELLERRANTTAIRDLVEEQKDDVPGVSLSCIRTIGANKPGARAKERASYRGGNK